METAGKKVKLHCKDGEAPAQLAKKTLNRTK